MPKGGNHPQVRAAVLIILFLISAVLLFGYRESLLTVLSDQQIGSIILVAFLSIDLLLFAFLYLGAEVRQKTAELAVRTEKLAQSETQLAEILQGISIPVFVIGTDHTVAYWNKACEAMTGIISKDIVGTNDQWKAFYPERRPTLADLVVDGVLDFNLYEPGKIERAAFVDGAYQGRSFFTPNNQEPRWLEFTASPIRGPKNELIGAVETLVDITKVKESDRLKTDFLSIAAHQLRTPLGSLRWTAEILLGGDLGRLPKEAKEKVSLMEETIKHLIVLVNELLNVTRIDQGRVQDNPVRTNLIAVVRRVMNDVQGEAEERSVKLKLTTNGRKAIPYVIDPERFVVVVQNLLSNGIKYNHSGGAVTIKLSQTKHAVVLTVADTGIGISAEDLPHVYSKFFRGHNAQRSHTNGSGLGLFVVKSYVEGWGGVIACKSKEGEGTTCSVTLPLRQKAVQKHGKTLGSEIAPETL